MDNFWSSVIVALITGAIVPIAAEIIRRWRPKSEVQLNIAQAANELLEGGEKSVNSASRLLERYEKLFEEQNERIARQDAEIQSLKATIIAIQIDEESARKRMAVRVEAAMEYIRLLISILIKYVPEKDIPPMPDALKESSPKIQAIK